ncbi:MAG: hypothetical protein WA610_07255 [Thermodesulfovibrionales bacterium]
MKEESTIMCRQCGVKHYMTPDGKGHMMPVFCCGSELIKAEVKATSSNALKKTVRKKK